MPAELDAVHEAEEVGRAGRAPAVPRPAAARPRASVPSARIFNIQRFSTEDGPGIRTTVFLKGCPLTCFWCANPESQSGGAQVAHNDALCDQCNRCVEVCEKRAIELAPEGGIRIDRRLCNDCGACVPVCVPRALRMIGDLYTLDQVFEEIQKDQTYYRNSGGGVTCSGGEPLSQARFVAALFERCHRYGIHTTIDTCGSARPGPLESVLEHTDLVLFDLKLFDRAAHVAAAGRSNEQILENARIIARKGVPMIARVPLIPGYTDSDENVDAIARFVRGLPAEVPVNVLPYHRFGVNKYRMIDKPYLLGEQKPLAPERVREIASRFESAGLECEIVT